VGTRNVIADDADRQELDARRIRAGGPGTPLPPPPTIDGRFAAIRGG
jgi:hypothetical protein